MGVLHGTTVVQIRTYIVLGVCLLAYDVLDDKMYSKFVQYSSGVLGDSELGICVHEQDFNLHGVLDSKFVECMHIAFVPPILPLDTYYYSTVHSTTACISKR